MGQVARERKCHREPGRVAQRPLSTQRDVSRILAGRHGRRLETDGPREQLVAGRVGQRQDGIELQDRVELEEERHVRRLDLPGIGQTDRADAGLENQAMRAIGLEIAGENRECDAAGARSPRGKLFQGHAARTQHAMRPFQVFGVDAAAAVIEKRHFVGHRDRNLGFERSRVAAAGTPGHGEPAAHDGLLFLGDKLIQEPEPRQRRTGSLARLFRSAELKIRSSS